MCSVLLVSAALSAFALRAVAVTVSARAWGTLRRGRVVGVVIAGLVLVAAHLARVSAFGGASGVAAVSGAGVASSPVAGAAATHGAEPATAEIGRAHV